ncbi:unnamed protein product [Dovyalis caffra]|uniref:Bromo domain-containing protein n=1 Tax=Dovyalis caffra TaxID=77055 RepID=A0AAV1QZY9_9ROSI|nr:unnamed protein product [Dovyalis caffra]
MALRKYIPSSDAPSGSMKPLSFSSKGRENAQLAEPETTLRRVKDVDVELSEVYFLIMHFLSAGPCQRTCVQFWNELLEHQLLPRRYHAWYARSGAHSGDENDNGLSFPLSYNSLEERYPHIEKNHLVKLLKQLLLNTASSSEVLIGDAPNAADVPTLLGMGDRDKGNGQVKHPPAHMRWPHRHADQVRGLSLREIGGGFARHHRAPSIRAACYAIAKPSTMVQKMQNVKRVRGHPIFDRSGRYVVTGSDDRLVKIWSMETAFCLASCRGHEGDITDLAVNSNNTLVASSSNDCIIRVWRLPDGMPISVLRGHSAAVTAIAFSPRPGSAYQLLSSSDDGTCRIWDARSSNLGTRIYVPRPPDPVAGKNSGPQRHQIFCCSFNAHGTVFVTGSSDHLARVWNALKSNTDDSDLPNHEIDVLPGHENDVNYDTALLCSGCAVPSRFSMADCPKEENIPKFKNSWYSHDSIVTCSRDGSAIIWIPKSRRSHVNDLYLCYPSLPHGFLSSQGSESRSITSYEGKAGRWIRHYHLKVPPPPMPPQPPRGGPRQRILPTPRGVNMIVWSLDNRFVLAAIMVPRVLEKFKKGKENKAVILNRLMLFVGVGIGYLVLSKLEAMGMLFTPFDSWASSGTLGDDSCADCRICVWNAADGSLVHSLTGHTQSTYVLDVHPFNPRIAMSAGYDGKTIVWDIWEGTPIRIYEISHFKLVDGKFSPDGTSIILSDDVGQLYILNTGQGESQKDAKYDQFFLGDYRPLIQDTYGNVLDQETQLVPFRRNMQDLLCDSGMIPYTEPYQSMYQQRRLGALGVEWKPSSIRFAVGPDFSLDPDNQILPLADLDVLVEPLPEFIDAMDWEPENDMQSDDNDSEYNAPEEHSSEAEQGSSNSSSSVEPEDSAEDSEAEARDGFRRSKRRKQKAEIEIMTASGRRVKRKNLDECDGNSMRSNRIRKSRIGRKASKRKSSISKALRPQRAAARNALSLFSKITGTATDGEDEDGSEGDVSETESGMQDSNIESESDESDRSFHDEENRNLKGKDILEESEDFAKSHQLIESHMNTINRRRLVLKLPVRDSSKIMLPDSGIHKYDDQVDLVGSSSKTPQAATEVNGVPTSSQDPGYFSCDAHDSIMDGGRRAQIDNYPLDLSEGYKNGDIRWGGVKARTSKRQRLGESISSATYTGSSACLGEHNENENILNRYSKLKEDNGTISPSLEVQNNSDNGGVVPVNGRNAVADTSEAVNDMSNGKEHPTCNGSVDSDKLPNLGHMANGNDNPPDLRESLPSFSTKIRIRSKKMLKDSLDNQGNGGCDLPTDKPANMTQNPVKEMLEHDGSNGITPEYKGDGLEELDTRIGEISMPPLDDSVASCSHPKKMFDVVYRRSKPGRGRVSTEGDGIIREDTSSACDPHLDSRGDSYEGKIGGSHGLKAPTHDANIASNNLQLGQGHESDDTCRDTHNGSINRCQLPREEWGSSSRMTVRLRSTRNRKASYHFRDTSPVDGRKLHQSAKRASWLMLSMHEEGSRYIPQQGDEVAYLRQGHQEYIDCMKSKEAGPWKAVKGNIRAVEFCKVEALEYAALAGSGDGCCKMTLRFVDPTSSAFQKSFKLTLPEMTGFPDFLVERTRFDAAIQRNWSRRDKCKVWWKNEGEEDGDWWYGRVLYTKPKSSEFPDSPWERCTVQYKSDPKELHQHSPWELFDDGTKLEQPHIDEEVMNKLLSAFAKLERSGKKDQDHYGVEKLRQVSQKSNFTNRFPVPLSLEVIQSRLENNYYRSLEALKHDFEVTVSNAESYFEKNGDLLTKMRRLSNWFARTLSSL